MDASRVGSQRWLVVAAALVIQLVLGTVYAFSVFRQPLMRQFGWSLTSVSAAFTICLVSFTLSMIVAGRWQDRVGPRRVATVGGLLLGGGLFLASFTRNLSWLYLSYGVLAGAGIGFGYVTPIAAMVKWFPHQRGMMTGLAVCGFGAGSLVFAPVATYLIGRVGVLATFGSLGLLFLVLATGAAQFLTDPPAGWAGSGSRPSVPAAAGHTPREMVGTVSFWLLWLEYLVGAGAGLMVISQAAPLAMELARVDAARAAAAVGLLSVGNGVGRLFWGAFSDRLGRTRSLVAIFLLMAVSVGLGLGRATTYSGVVGSLMLVALAFGGILAVMPALTADFFGTRHYGTNYGWLFTAYGAAAVLGPLLIARAKESLGTYGPALGWFAALSVGAAVLAALTSRPGSPSVKPARQTTSA